MPSEESPPRRWQVLVICLWCVGWLGWTVWDFLWRGIARAVVSDLEALSQLRFCASFFSLTTTRMFHIAATFVLLASAVVIGRWVLRGLRLASDEKPATLLTGLAIGLLVFGNVVLVLGLLGFMQPWVFWLLVILPIILWLSHRAQRRGGSFSTLSRPNFWSESDWFGKTLLGLAVAACLINLLGAFVPPHEYDTLKYQLAAPKEYLLRGRIEFLPHNFYANMPSLVNMLYLWGMVVGAGGNVETLLSGGDGIPQILNWCFGILSAIALFFLAQPRLGKRCALYAASAFYLSPRIFELSGAAFADIGICFFALVAVAEAWSAVEAEDQKAILRSALIAGATLSCKYTASLIVVVPLTLAVALHCIPNWRRAMRWACIFLLVSLLVVTPWLLRSWVWTSNPVFPFLHQVFASPLWDEAMQKAFDQQHHAAWQTGDIHQLGTWLKFTPKNAALLAWIVPPCIVLPSLIARLSFGLFWAASAAVFWLGLMNLTWRYIFPIFPLICLAGASAFCVAEQKRISQWVARVTLAVLLVVSFLRGTLHNPLRDLAVAGKTPPIINAFSLCMGSISRAEFVHSLLPAVDWMNKNLAPAATVLYVGEDRTYYARHKVIYRTAYGERVLTKLAGKPQTADEWQAALRKTDVAHVFVDWDRLGWQADFYGDIEDVDWRAFDAFLKERGRLIYPKDQSAKPSDQTLRGACVYELVASPIN